MLFRSKQGEILTNCEDLTVGENLPLYHIPQPTLPMNTVVQHHCFYPHGCYNLFHQAMITTYEISIAFQLTTQPQALNREMTCEYIQVVIYSTLIQEELLAQSLLGPSASRLLPPLLCSISFGVSISPSVMAPQRLY